MLGTEGEGLQKQLLLCADPKRIGHSSLGDPRTPRESEKAWTFSPEKRRSTPTARLQGLPDVWLMSLEVDQVSVTGVISLAQSPFSSQGNQALEGHSPTVHPAASLSPGLAPKENPACRLV